jgi:hexulose-6-phosphate isomerase
MKKGICFGCLPKELSIEDKFQLARDAGFDGVEINAVETDDELLTLKKAADHAGVAIPSIMGMLHWQYPLSSPNADDRKKCADGFRTSLRHARTIGADTVLCVPAVVNEDVSYEEAWERSREEISQLAKVAEAEKVVLAIENVWNRFLLSPIEFARYIDEFQSSYIKAYFDCGNILMYGHPHQWIRTLGNRIQKIHVKDFHLAKRDFVYLLQGNVPWKRCMEALLAIGYDDYITAEMPPYQQLPEQMVYDTARHIDCILRSIE